MKDNAIAILSKAPLAGSSKTRLSPPFSLKQCALLSHAFLKDVLDTAVKLNNTDIFIYCVPGTKKGSFKNLSKDVKVKNEEGRSLGEKLAFIFNSLFAKGYKNIMVVAGDCPDMPKEYFRLALKMISKDNGMIVIGPSSDGAFNLIGVNAYNKASLNKGLAGIDWSPRFSLKRMMGKFKRSNAPLHVLPQWHDIDTFEDVIGFLRRNGRRQTYTGSLINEFLSS